jgi:hypothetical protein
MWRTGAAGCPSKPPPSGPDGAASVMKPQKMLAALIGLIIALTAGISQARVIELRIETRNPFAGGKVFGTAGPYEIIKGKLTYGIDPSHPANQAIVDLPLAPRNSEGAVSFAGDFVLLKPVSPDQGNRRLLMEVTNRGNLLLLPFFNFGAYNNDPSTAADAGDGFLLKQGYSLLFTAWNWDVSAGAGRLLIDLPMAMKNGVPLTGEVVVEMVATRRTQSMPFAWGNARGYPAVLAALPSASLTVRATQNGERTTVPRDAWQLGAVVDGQLRESRRHLFLAEGFKTGQIYELNYLATGPRVVGLGLAALRDAASFFRNDQTAANPLAGAMDQIVAFGHSQSGRVLQHMLWQGFHRDEAGRPVFDAIFLNAPGGGKGSFNHRFAQTTRHPSQHEDHQYPADIFPFATVPQIDTVTGRSADLFARVRHSGPIPKLFYTQTSTDYWTRSASLLHSDVTGRHDLAIDPNARLFVFAGAQHFVWVPRRRGRFAHCHNPADYRYLLRALLARLDDWVSEGQPPPPSKYPTFVEGALGSLPEYQRQFPHMSGLAGPLRPPKSHLRPPRLDLGPRFAELGIIDHHPPGFGPPFETSLPLPDEDGIDRGGIRLPEIAVPLGTYLGWNHRRDGAVAAIGRWSGSYIPFPAADDHSDARRPLEQRYDDGADYVRKVRSAARELVKSGYLRAGDIARITNHAGRRYQAQSQRRPNDPGCGYLTP